jgi:hypothetical protein
MKLPPRWFRGLKEEGLLFGRCYAVRTSFIKTYALPSCGNLPDVPEKDNSQAISQDASEALTYDDDRDDDKQDSPSEARSVLTQTSPSPLPPPPPPFHR